MSVMQGHPGVEVAFVERRGFHCPRCDDEDLVWLMSRWAVPLADGETIVCWGHASELERRNRWCETCQRVLDVDAFDRISEGDRSRGHRRSCRACRTPAEIDRARPCEHCGASFTPSRSDARFCSGRCRVAAHRD